MHDARSKCQNLAGAIQTIFEKGLHVNRNSHHFILSTIFISDIRELETIITDPSNCESDSLIELIYFPDESVQLRLEDRLESETFQQKDKETVLKHLLSCCGNTLVRFEGLQPVLTIKTLETGARAFLDRLNITRQLDPELIRVIDQRAGRKDGKKHKVWLRNMVMDLSERDNVFIKDLFLKMDARQSRFEKYLYFSLRFLEESKNDADLFQSLKQCKTRCLKHLRQSDRLETYRRGHNIETLMAQGIRIPYADKQALLLQIALADDICLALFNRSM
ncbi:MAG: hypothetical protein QNK29_15040 [Desulfobacterales bacterium]|nr:hypothetical protein [Desulfobacterales bacterium]MDX2513295.1 hypothetical protein [Desulfobacterales bacterium]